MEATKFNILINRIKKFDKNAFNEIYDEYSRLVLWIAKKITKNDQDALDVLNIVFIAIWTDAESYGYIKKPDDWMSEIARNKAINFYNKYIKRQSNDVDFDNISEINTYRYLTLENNFSELEFDAILSILNEKEQQIVKLKIFYKYTHVEIAEKLNLPHGTVCWAFNNALKKLRIKFLEKNTS